MVITDLDPKATSNKRASHSERLAFKTTSQVFLQCKLCFKEQRANYDIAQDN